jgi:SAM-dependent methyltransferase
MSGFTDKAHLSKYAYNDAKRLADRGAIYKYLKIDSIELGTHAFRAEGLPGVVSTFVDPNLAGTALDVGCGAGQYPPLLSTQFESVVAADLSNGMLAAVPGGDWQKVMADVEAMPFVDDAFDLVLANHMLYHCPNLEFAVGELNRVLRPGAMLIATTNGDSNFADAYALLAKAASLVLGHSAGVLSAADARFTLESGSVALGASFETVNAYRTVGYLLINDAQSLNDLRAYFRSVDDEWCARYDVEWPALESALDEVLAESMQRSGEIRIGTMSGVLIAT